MSSEEFSKWQSQEVSAYQAGLWACFLKVIVDLGFTHFVASDLPFTAVRAVGATIDLSWLAVLVVTFFRTNQAKKRRRQLGIVLGGFASARSSSEEGESDPAPSDRPKG